MAHFKSYLNLLFTFELHISLLFGQTSLSSTSNTFAPRTSGILSTSETTATFVISNSSSSTTSYQWSGPLNCSAYSLNSTNMRVQQMSMQARLHSCFNDNPYDTSQPPLPPGAAPYIHILYDYSLMYVIDFDGNSIKFVGQLMMQWTDYYRMWNLNELPVYTMQMPISEIWYPQVVFMSTVTKNSLYLIDPEDIVLLANENVTQFAVIIKKNIIEAHCEVNYTNFPFDRQVCSIDFGILRYFFTDSAFDVILTRQPNTYKFETFKNEEWQLLEHASLPINITFHGYAVERNGRATNNLTFKQQNAQTGFNVKITLKRYPQYYVINLGVPVIVLTVVGQTAFAIPEHSDAKLGIPLTVLTGFMFIQSLVVASFPNAKSPPNVGLYITGCVLLSGCSCLVCALIMQIENCRCRVPRQLSSVIRWAHVVLFPSHWPTFLKRVVFFINRKLNRNKKSVNRNQNIIENPIIENLCSPTIQFDETTECSNSSTIQENDVEEKRAAHGWHSLAAILNRVISVAHFLVILLLYLTLVNPIVDFS